jgi:hypothetical protein
MSAVWFVLQKPIASLWTGLETVSWEKLCTKLFGFNEAEIRGDLDDDAGYRLMRDPTTYDTDGERDMSFDGTLYGLLDKTKRHIPEPILSHRVARIALACMWYLHHQHHNDPPIQDNRLTAWATKSKQLPWLWRKRMRVTAIGRRQTTWDYDGPEYSLPQSLRRSYQRLFSEGIQSDDFYQERHIFYIWTLDLLYHTLHASMKSDELIKALSKPFIPAAACIFFPHHIKRVQKAGSAYLEKVGRRACSDLGTPTEAYLYINSSVRRIWTPQE